MEHVPVHSAGDRRRRARDQASPRRREAAAPGLETNWDPLEHVYERSLVDLAALRFESPLFPGASLPAAGLPWFMTVFGRDSLITSFQALPFTPELAATPLFLVLLDEYERWTGDAELVQALKPNALAALEWIDRHDEYVTYDRRNTETGLENQCWKDSWDSIRFADGTIAEGPIATCEIQGYVYDAKRRGARLARELWDDAALADRLEREAAALRERFERDFWLPERGFYAEALDGEGRAVDSITSNAGHLLWSGIVSDERAESVAAQLLSDALFSGWGVRTMAEGEGGYNPIRYHNGTVWPHDNSLIALGLARYGYREEAARIAEAMLEAATFFRHRLPEVFAGYRRQRTSFPVEYPTSCSPQAWATGTPLALLRVMLGLEPNGEELISDPWLPDRIGRIELRDIPGRWGHTNATTLKEVVG